MSMFRSLAFRPSIRCDPLGLRYFQSKPTIYALSTAPGKAGVAIIRISGPNSPQVLRNLLSKPSLFPKARYGALRGLFHPQTRDLLDKALVLYFPGPASFTGEDIVELHTHGGNAVVRAVLEAIGSTAHNLSSSSASEAEGENNTNPLNVRYAEAGEFARRAFDNGRLDLTEAEGLADLINAETTTQLRSALRQAGGALKDLYDTWRTSLLHSRALLEAIIDFGEDEGIEDGIYEQVVEKVVELRGELERHLERSVRGELLRNGVHLTIFGPPNAGKSSLLNRLASRAVSIVSPHAGTTRDIIESTIDIGGYPVIVGDTAGIREGEDVGEVEMEGVKRARERVSSGDLGVCVLDLTTTHQHGSVHIADEILQHLPVRTGDSRPTILLLNKIDLQGTGTGSESESGSGLEALRKEYAKATGIGKEYIFFSTLKDKTGTGIDEFTTGLIRTLKSMTDIGTTDVVGTNERHRTLVGECISHLDNFMKLREEAETRGEGADIVLGAEEVRYAADALGKICGRVDVEEVLGVVFGQFCVGK
ncbi:tRNA modification GTPase gtpbp3, mitochondrial [Saitoella coloradoensis]